MFSLIDLLFPNRCLRCSAIIGGKDIVCENCYDKIDFTHWEHQENNPLKMRLSLFFPIQNAYALMTFDHEGLSRQIIHQLKYAHREAIGKTLALWCIEKIKLHRKPDLLVSVPLHPKKLKKRGYNQLHLFADTLAEAWSIPHDPAYLKRSTHHKAQARKDRKHRQQARNKFESPHPTQGQSILLIDDVCTTGNTLASCARPILQTQNSLDILVMAVD